MEAERIAEHYLDGAQRAIKSRGEFTFDFLPTAHFSNNTVGSDSPHDVAAQQRVAATSFRKGGREVFGLGCDKRTGSGARADKVEVFVVAWGETAGKSLTILSRLEPQ